MHEVPQLAFTYDIEMSRMKAILVNWAKSEIVEKGRDEGGSYSVRLVSS